MARRIEVKPADSAQLTNDELREWDSKSGAFDVHTRDWDGFKSLDPSYHSAAEPPTCHVICPYCSEQFLPRMLIMFAPVVPIKLHSDQRAASEINGFISKITNNIAEMKKQIESHGDALISRWKKRTPSRRETLLLKAKPDLYRRKQAEANLTLETAEAVKTAYTKMTPAYKGQEAALTPYLDVQTLCEDPLKLLALIQYRSHASPSDWILFDCRQMRNYFHMGQYNTAYNPHCMVALGPDFGKLVQWEPDSAHKWDMIGYAAARLALKSQSILTDFLCKMISLLLEGDLSQSPKGHFAWDELVKQSFRAADSEGTVWAYTDSPFSAAPTFDIVRMEELLMARRNAAEDDLWLLQTDPLHLRQLVDRFNASSLCRQLKQSDRRKLLNQITLGNIRRLTDWDTLRDLAEDISTLKGIFDRGGETGTALQTLQKEYKDYVNVLEASLNSVFESLVEDIMVLCAALPSFRHHFKADSEGKFEIATEPADAFRQDKLFWNISELQQHADHMSPPLSHHLANIDTIISNGSKKEKERIDQVVLDRLSDLAAVEEALSSIRYHRSRMSLTLSKMDRNSVGLPALGETTFTGFLDIDRAKMLEGDVTWNSGGAEAAWTSLEEFCGLPKPIALATKQDVSRMSVLYDALAAYWQAVRDAKENILQIHPMADATSTAAYLEKISMGLSKEHKAKVKVELDSVLVKIEKKVADQQSIGAGSLTGVCVEQSFFSTVETSTTRVAPKKKVKTRPQQDLAADMSALSVDDTSDAPSSKTAQIEVKKKSFDFFHRMFSSFPSGMSRWSELVAALSDAGFSATSNGGSARSFRNQNASKGTIVFHRPHRLDSNIAPEMLRGFGKRLNKWFGWDEDTFVVRSK